MPTVRVKCGRTSTVKLYNADRKYELYAKAVTEKYCHGFRLFKIQFERRMWFYVQ